MSQLGQHLSEVIRIKKSTHSIALGFSIGTFISILPTPGFSILIGLLILLIFKKVNKIAMLAAFVIWNPLVQAPIYLLSYKLGDLLLGAYPVVEYQLPFWYTVYHFSRRFFVGNLIIGVCLAITSYFLVKQLAQFYQRK